MKELLLLSFLIGIVACSSMRESGSLERGPAQEEPVHSSADYMPGNLR